LPPQRFFHAKNIALLAAGSKDKASWRLSGAVSASLSPRKSNHRPVVIYLRVFPCF
jgi:hypothetical protein